MIDQSLGLTAQGGQIPPGETVDSAGMLDTTTIGATTPARAHKVAMATIREAIKVTGKKRNRTR